MSACASLRARLRKLEQLRARRAEQAARITVRLDGITRAARMASLYAAGHPRVVQLMDLANARWRAATANGLV